MEPRNWRRPFMILPLRRTIPCPPPRSRLPCTPPLMTSNTPNLLMLILPARAPPTHRHLPPSSLLSPRTRATSRHRLRQPLLMTMPTRLPRPRRPCPQAQPRQLPPGRIVPTSSPLRPSGPAVRPTTRDRDSRARTAASRRRSTRRTSRLALSWRWVRRSIICTEPDILLRSEICLLRCDFYSPVLV